MGRHEARPTRRRGRRLTLVLALLGVVAVLATGAWFAVDYLRGGDVADCPNPTPLTVAVAPDIAPAVTEVARGVRTDEPGSCYRVDVVARDSANAADWLAEAEVSEQPDVWVPESTVWLSRAREKGATNVSETATSLASTPVVMALPEEAAIERGWPNKQLTWSDVITPDSDLTVGMPDPSVAATGISALLAMKALAAQAPDPQAHNVSLLRKVSPNATADTAELYDRLLTGNATTEPGVTKVTAFPTSESALLRYNAQHPNGQLVAVYPNPAAPSLDYPYSILPKDQDVTHAAERFRTALLATDAAGAFGASGFRSPDGRVLGDITPDDRTAVRLLRPVPPPDGKQLDEALNTWAGVTRSSRVVSVLDVSGSMNAAIPGTGKTRMQVALEANAQGVTLFNPRTKLSVWTFSTELDADRDYHEVVPVATVADHMANGLPDRLRAIRAKPNGQTGLYDTTLAAYQAAKQAWEPGRLNVVVITTDGRNEDSKSISRGDLLAELGRMQDPARPLPIVLIGIGPDIDTTELAEIATASKGVSFTTTDPAKIGDIYYSALSRLMCQANCG